MRALRLGLLFVLWPVLVQAQNQGNVVKIVSIETTGCRVKVEDVSPFPGGGGRVQFKREDGSNFEKADADGSDGYTRTAPIGPGSHAIHAIWTKAGQATVTRDPQPVECKIGVPPPPVCEKGEWTVKSETCTSCSGQVSQTCSIVEERIVNPVGCAPTTQTRDETRQCPPPGVDPVMTAPEAGSTLSGPTQTFSWTSGRPRYWLYVGSSLGARDIHDSGTLDGSVTSRAVSAIPVDSRTIYARLWWYSNETGEWTSGDYQYKAFGGGPIDEICGDGIDNDQDGEIDEGCPPPPPPGEATTCSDATDNMHEHPRLWVTCPGGRNSIDQVKARLEGLHRAAMQLFVNEFDDTFDGYSVNDSVAFRNASFITLFYPLTGITYRHTLDQYVAKLRQFADAQIILGQSTDSVQVYNLATAYDLGFARFSAAQRQGLVRAMQNNTCGREDVSVFHHIDMRYRLQCAYQGLAYANDGIDDAGAQTRITSIAKLVDGPSGIRSGMNWLGHPLGNEGWIYSQTNQNGPSWHAWQWELQYEHAMNVSRFDLGTYPAMEQMAEFTYRMFDGYKTTAGGYQDQLAWNYRTNQTGQGWADDGDGEYYGGGLSAAQDFTSWLGQVKSRYSGTDVGAFAEWFASKHAGRQSTGNPGHEFSLGYRYGFFRLVYDRPAIAKSPTQLGLSLTKRYDNFGVVFMRSSLDFDQPHINVVLEGTPYVYDGNGYGPTARGNFTVSGPGGPLVVNNSNGPHHGIGTISTGYNTPQFCKAGTPVDQEDYAACAQRDNWSVGPAPNRWDVYVPGSKWDMGGLRAGMSQTNLTATNGRSDYVSMDLTKAYPPDAVKKLVQDFAFFRPSDPSKRGFVVLSYLYEKTDASVEARIPFWFPGDSQEIHKPTIGGYTGTSTVPRGDHTHIAYTEAKNMSLDWADLGMKILGNLSFFASSPYKVVDVSGRDVNNQSWTDLSHEWELPNGRNMGPGSYGQAGSKYPHLWPWTSQGHAEIIPSAVSGRVSVVIDIPPVTSTTWAPVTKQVTTTAECLHFDDRSFCVASGANAQFIFSEVGQRYALLTKLTPNSQVSLTPGANVSSITDLSGSNCATGCKVGESGVLEVNVNVTVAGNSAGNTVSVK